MWAQHRSPHCRRHESHATMPSTLGGLHNTKALLQKDISSVGRSQGLMVHHHQPSVTQAPALSLPSAKLTRDVHC